MISFSSVQDFYDECTTGLEFEYQEKWYLIEFDDPFHGIGKVRIHLRDEIGGNYFDTQRCIEYDNLESLVHNYKIGLKTLAEIICDDNNIPRSVLPVKRCLAKWQQSISFGEDNE